MIPDFLKEAARGGLFLVRSSRNGALLCRLIDHGIPEPTSWYLVTSSHYITNHVLLTELHAAQGSIESLSVPYIDECQM